MTAGSSASGNGVITYAVAASHAPPNRTLTIAGCRSPFPGAGQSQETSTAMGEAIAVFRPSTASGMSAVNDGVAFNQWG